MNRKKIKKIFNKFFKKIIPVINAFTLVELIVVITILLVLSTIVFYSVTGYLKQARDVSRFENLNRIDFGIELFVIEKGFYPKPDNGIEITFSGSELWNQGTFGDNLLLSIGKLSAKPVDLVSMNDFTYSLANDGKQYELGAVLESDQLILNNFVSETYAKSRIPVRSMVVGNYNGFTLSVGTGGLVYILALPTILSYDTTETDIIKLIEKKTLAYRGYGNIAASYTGTVFIIDGGFDFDPNIFVLYSGTYDNLINNESEWIQLLKNTQSAYTGTILDPNPLLDKILGIDIDLLNPSKEVRELAYDLVINDLNISLPIELTSGSNWLTYDLTNGLLDSDTRSITQDSLSNLWFATKNGVSTFIGNTWGSYTEADGLVDKDVRVVIESDNLDMRFATNKGVSIFDGTTWTTLTKSDGLIDDDVVALIQDSLGNYWFATKKGISMYDGITWTNYDANDGLADKIVTGITEGSSGNIWISTIDGVSKFDGTTWITYNITDGLVDKNVLSIYTDNLGNIWFGTIDGVSKFDGNSWVNYNESDGLIDKYVNNIFQDADDNMRFGTAAGASMFDGVNWINYTIDDGLADNDVQVIFQDFDLNIWFGTKDGVTIYFN
ncbi:MAG: two-component regulator propeller domain-containing protein [Candidatus Gracilibacteria bacterium]